MFKATNNQGFQMTFENGLTISVQWGPMNYCAQRSQAFAPHESEGHRGKVNTSIDAEIAIWDAKDHWFDFGSDTVKGWVKADEVAHWIYLAEAAIHLDHLKRMATGWGMIEGVETPATPFSSEDSGPEYDSAGFTENDR